MTDITDVGQPVDGHWSNTGTGLRIDETGYDRLFVIGEIDWQDYEALVPVTIDRVDPPGPNSDIAAVGMIARFQGHAASGFGADPTAQPKWGFLPLGGICWLQFVSPQVPNIGWFRGDESTSYFFGSLPITLGNTYMMRMRVETLPDSPEGFGVSRYSYKVWDEATTEPVDWSYVVDQVSELALRQGSLGLVAHHVDATFGDVQITQLATRPPTVVAGDVDRDNKVTPHDAEPILGHVVGSNVLPEALHRVADLGGVDGVDAHDAALVQYIAAGGRLAELPSIDRAVATTIAWGRPTTEADELIVPFEIPGGASLRSWSIEVRGENLGRRVRAVTHDLRVDAQWAWHADGDVVRIAFAAAEPVDVTSTLVRLVLEAHDQLCPTRGRGLRPPERQ